MCIACELGYWSMIDALEAERNALLNKGAPAAGQFSCEPDTKPEASEHSQQPADEPAP